MFALSVLQIIDSCLRSKGNVKGILKIAFWADDDSNNRYFYSQFRVLYNQCLKILPLRFKKKGKSAVWWRTRDSLSYVSK